MSIDRIAYPLPVIVKGYACLNQAEVELANKDIDPARPRNGPHERDTRSNAQAAPSTAPSPATQDVAKASEGRILSYAPGTVRTAAIETGLSYSVEA